MSKNNDIQAAGENQEPQKDSSMLMQKRMINSNYDALTSAPETGRKVCSTFVPGNLNELIQSFGMINNLPETNAIQNAIRMICDEHHRSAGWHPGQSDSIIIHIEFKVFDCGLKKVGS